MDNPLSPKQQAFVAAYLGPCRFNATKAAESAGYAHPNTQGPRLLVDVGIQDQIAKWRDEVKLSAITDLNYRITRLSEMENRLWQVVDARESAYANDAEVIGGASGMVAKQYKQVGSGPTAELIPESVADTSLTKEIRATYDDVAKELGQRVDKLNLSGEVGIRRYIGVDPDAV